MQRIPAFSQSFGRRPQTRAVSGPPREQEDQSAPLGIPRVPGSQVPFTGQLANPQQFEALRRADNRANARDVRLGQDPLANQRRMDNYARGEAKKNAAGVRQADFVDARRQGMAAAQQGGMIPRPPQTAPAAAQTTIPAAPGAGPLDGVPAGARPVDPQQGVPRPPQVDAKWPRAVSPDPGEARARVSVQTSPGTQATDVTPEQHMTNELHRGQNVAAQQARGLGVSVQEGGAFQPIPRPPSQAATPATAEEAQKDFARPGGVDGIPRQQMDAIDRDARMQAGAMYQRNVADAASGGFYSGRDLAQQEVGAFAQSAQAQLIEAGRSRQATPGSTPKVPSVAELQAELAREMAAGDGTTLTERAKSIQGLIDERIGVPAQEDAPRTGMGDVRASANDRIPMPPGSAIAAPVDPQAAWEAQTPQYRRTHSSPGFRESVGLNPSEAPATQPSGGVVDVATPEEARRLPSGTRFRSPDGVIRQVP